MPPPAEGFAARLVLGPALRTQPDRRLVALVRDGYENAFEEIVRRYGKPLNRYAAAIVGGRADDVTQDAFSKALLALRRDGAEIELRPWLFRIVRNTALNELRDHPPSPEVLAEAIAGGDNPAEELERREELADLMHRLQALPEPQRAAIVMRELEGLSHEEIAAALGLSGGGARQAIYRARQALREGLGILLPLPLLRLLIDHGGEAAAVGASAGGAAAASGAVGGAGAGMALKAGVVTAVLAGSVGTGIALQDRGHGDAGATAATTPSRTAETSASPRGGALAIEDDSDSGGSGESESSRRGSNRGGDKSGRGSDRDDRQVSSQQAVAASDGGRGPSSPAQDDHGRHGSGSDDRSSRHGPRPDGRGEDQGGGGSHSGPGSGDSRSSGGRSGGEPSEDSGGGPGPSGEGDGHRGSGSGGELVPPPPTAEEETRDGEDGSGSDGSNSGSGSGSSEGSGRIDELP